MTRRMTGPALRVLSLLLAFLTGIGALAVADDLGWRLPFGVGAERNDSQVISAVDRIQEVALLRLSIQGLSDEAKCTEAFGKCIPGSTQTMFLQYDFRAKLGIDGSQVKVKTTGENTYLITVPEFTFIGYDEPTFKVATEDGGALDWITPDIDQVDMVNDILDEEAQAKYLDAHADLLEEQTKVFYDSLITSIDPDAVSTYEFRS